MHRSRIGVVLIDHSQGFDEAVRFWSGVTGQEARPDEDGTYQAVGPVGGINVEVQHTGEGTPARVHLDIETDDVPAEVDRVVALGATVLEQREGYTILQDPGGLVFCVVPVQTGERFEAEAVTWE